MSWYALLAEVDAQHVQVIHNMSESEGQNNETPRTLLAEKPKSKNLKSAEEAHVDKPGDVTLEGI